MTIQVVHRKILVLAALLFQIHLEFADRLSMIFIVFLFFGFVTWMIVLHVRQGKIFRSLKHLQDQSITKEYLNEELERIKKEILETE